MGSRLLAGCLALLLFLLLIGSGVLYFLKYQQDLELEKTFESARELYLQPGRAEGEALDPTKRTQALTLFRNEIIPRGGNRPFVAEALYFVAEDVSDSEPEAARLFWQRIADQFPDSPRRSEALVRLAEFSVRANPEKAKELYSQVLDSTSTSDLQGDAELGVILLEDDPEKIPSKEVRDKYQAIIKKFPQSRASGKARERLDEAHRYLIFQDPNPNEFKQTYIIQKGDVLLKIANQFETTAYIIEMLSGVTSQRLRPNQQILVPTWGKVYVVVDKSDYRLMVFREADEAFLIQYSVGIGEMEWKTRPGEYIISTKEFHPPWPDPKSGKLLKYEDPDYPLGERWMGLSSPAAPDGRTGLGIHGTNQPETIGTSSSAGCVRMTNEDVVEAFAVVRLKSRVIIRD